MVSLGKSYLAWLYRPNFDGKFDMLDCNAPYTLGVISLGIGVRQRDDAVFNEPCKSDIIPKRHGK